MVKIYGIPNCDKIKKALNLLHMVGCNDFEFINFKTIPPTQEAILRWKRFAKGEWPINKRSQTYRKLKEQINESSEDELISLIIENPTILKRPILEIHGRTYCIGLEDKLFEKAIRNRDKL